MRRLMIRDNKKILNFFGLYKKWFGGDFNDDPLGFVLKYAEGEFKNQLETKKDQIKVKYLDYD